MAGKARAQSQPVVTGFPKPQTASPIPVVAAPGAAEPAGTNRFRVENVNPLPAANTLAPGPPRVAARQPQGNQPFPIMNGQLNGQLNGQFNAQPYGQAIVVEGEPGPNFEPGAEFDPTATPSPAVGEAVMVPPAAGQPDPTARRIFQSWRPGPFGGPFPPPVIPGQDPVTGLVDMPPGPPDGCQFPVEGYPFKACPPPPDLWCDGARWYFIADFLALRRDQPDNVAFATIGTPTNVVLATRLEDYSFRPAMRLRGGYSLTPTLRVEGLYFGLANWTECASVRDVSPNSLGGVGDIFSAISNFGQPPLAGVDYNTFASFNYTSTLDNAEINLRHRFWTPPYMEVSFLFGARYINIQEQLNFNTQSTTGVGSTNSVAVSGNNNLLGLQIGAIGNFPLEYDFWLQLEVKGALCQNNGSQRTFYNNTVGGASQVFETGKHGTSTSVVGEIILMLNYQCTDHIATRVGYQAMALNGLDLASQNLSRSYSELTLGPGNLIHTGRLFYHGPSCGVTFTW